MQYSILALKYFSSPLVRLSPSSFLPVLAAVFYMGGFLHGFIGLIVLGCLFICELLRCETSGLLVGGVDNGLRVAERWERHAVGLHSQLAISPSFLFGSSASPEWNLQSLASGLGAFWLPSRKGGLGGEGVCVLWRRCLTLALAVREVPGLVGRSKSSTKERGDLWAATSVHSQPRSLPTPR